MLTVLHPQNPNPREIEKVVSLLNNDAVVICPTDTVYAYVCALNSKKAYQKLLQIKGMQEKKAQFSLLFGSLSQVADFARIDNLAFRMLKNNEVENFTFIFHASGKVPDKLLNRRKFIGVRISKNPIVQHLIEKLELPLLTTSIKIDDEIVEYETDPEVLHEQFGNQVDAVIDGGFGGNVPSTIVDCSLQPYEIIREGKGVLV